MLYERPKDPIEEAEETVLDLSDLPQEKQNLIQLFAEGHSPAEVESLLHISSQTCRKWHDELVHTIQFRKEEIFERRFEWYENELGVHKT